MKTKLTSEQEERIAAAKSKYDDPWWDSDDPRKLFWGQLNEDVLIIDFSKFHEAAEKALGRAVWTHEFAFKQSLIDEFRGKTPKATFTDVLNKIPTNKKIILVST